ncbi:MAG TPA: hypothetical protein VLQ76_08195 [Bacteroidales bacterium]|nr:hypothetical protein [Bacteroidales bacterium]
MKKTLLLLLIALAVVSCKKTRMEPEGPTDVRVYNNTDVTFDNVTVNTSGGEFNFGSVAPHQYSNYHRYEKAYPKADISLTIVGVEYSTTQQDYTYMQYMGQMKITYRIFIRSQALKELDTDVVAEGEIEGL